MMFKDVKSKVLILNYNCNIKKEKTNCESSLKNLCETSWISKIKKLENENASLEFQVQSLLKECENIKLEYKKLFDSIKNKQTQSQKEINELIESVNKKTYAYGDVRAKNQDLLIKFSKLKAKLKTVEKVKKIVTNVDDKNALKAKDVLCVSCDQNVLTTCHDKCLAKYKLSANSKVRRALYTAHRTAKSKTLNTTPVVAKTR
ncbi:hypothetical protein Tco_1211839 [Tanacetum coccineum]